MRLLSALVLMLVVGPVSAQESAPPPFEDSLLALVRAPSEVVGEDVVMLLEDGYYRVDEDGTTARTTRQVIQIVTDDGASAWGEFSFPFDQRRDSITLDWLRVIENGVVVQEGPAHQQVSNPRVDQSAPVYSDAAVLQATLARVRPGSIVDYRVTVRTFDPLMPGDFYLGWRLNEGYSIRRARLVVDTPEDIEVTLRDGPAGPLRTEYTEGGRRRRVWFAAEQEPVEYEAFAAFPNDVIQFVQITSGAGWSELGAMYSSFLPAELEVGTELARAHDKVLAGASTLTDSLRATYRWVAQDFRYVSLALGDGGYRARPPQEVFETGFGDCKDKTLLFVALATRLGVSATPLLVSTDGGVDPDLPSLRQFNHMIAALEVDGETVYADLTTRVSPFGETPGYLQGESGLMVSADGAASLITVPAPEASENAFISELVGTVDNENRFKGSLTLAMSGAEQSWLRSDFYNIHGMSRGDRDALEERYAQSVWNSASVDSTWVFDGKDLTQPAKVTVWFTVENVVGSTGNRLLLNLPLPRYGSPDVVASLRDDEEREFPIDVSLVNAPTLTRHRLEITVPQRWVAEMPDNVFVSGDFGYYRSEYTQEGRTLILQRELSGARGILPPSKGPELLDWAERLADDNTSYLLIDPSGPITETATGDDLVLSGILLSGDDLGEGATLVSDREGASEQVGSVSTGKTIREHSHEFSAEDMVFTAGGSNFIYLTASASEYHTRVEALKDVQVLDLMDVGSVMGASMASEMGDQASVTATEELELPRSGDFASAWRVAVQVPMGTMDFLIAGMSRGRVSTSVIGVAAGQVAAADVDSLLSVMADRIEGTESYMEDLTLELEMESELDAEDVAEAAHGFRLTEMLLGPSDLSGSRIIKDELEVDGFWPTISRDLSPMAFTTRLGNSELLGIEMDIVVAETAGRAVKRLVSAREVDEESFILFLGDPEEYEVAEGLSLDSWDRVWLSDFPYPALKASGTFDAAGMDVGVVMFAMDRLLVRIEGSAPVGQLDLDDLVALASVASERIGQVSPTTTELEVTSDQLRAVEAVVELEEPLNDLVRDGKIEEALNLMERDYPDSDFARLEFNSWNNICWYGALHGFADRVVSMCDYAFDARDDIPPYRDSRGLARALTGDFEGAIADFRYVIEEGDQSLRDTRIPYLEKLLKGENPFTEEELATLRGEG